MTNRALILTILGLITLGVLTSRASVIPEQEGIHWRAEELDEMSKVVEARRLAYNEILQCWPSCPDLRLSIEIDIGLAERLAAHVPEALIAPEDPLMGPYGHSRYFLVGDALAPAIIARTAAIMAHDAERSAQNFDLVTGLALGSIILVLWATRFDKFIK